MPTKSATKRLSNRLAEIIRASAVAALVPVFFLYVFLERPDYRIMNAASHVVVPVALAVGDVLSWPFRMVGQGTEYIRAMANAKSENAELRARLDDALAMRTLCDIAIAENARLETMMGIAREMPQTSVIARVILDASVFGSNQMIISRGSESGVRQRQVVVSMDGNLVGIITDVFPQSSVVKGLSDLRSNIPVRVAGTEVYGFLRGLGEGNPRMEFFSDQEFTPTVGTRLVSSGIRGILPHNLPVGRIVRVGTIDARVQLHSTTNNVHEVMVLMFDGGDGYR
ncbi:MAG: rod shape-determining protein MreC [Alphaproteobacteria bacterium]|nr:rod shape-determining protein MreC [Alphaproteobacteria bacterium]